MPSADTGRVATAPLSPPDVAWPGPRVARLAPWAAVGLAVAALIPTDRVHHGPPLCLSRAVTGYPCPACGLVRGCVHLAHGDVLRALELNPFSLLVLGTAVAVLAYAGWAAVRRRPTAHVWGLVPGRAPTVALAGLAAYGIVRLLGIAVGWWGVPA